MGTTAPTASPRSTTSRLEPTVNPPTIKLLNDTTTSSVVFTLAELMTHWNGSLEYCRAFGGGLTAETLERYRRAYQLWRCSVLTLTPRNNSGGFRDNGGGRSEWTRSNLTLPIAAGTGGRPGFKYVILRG